jgi:hypothetical protein
VKTKLYSLLPVAVCLVLAVATPVRLQALTLTVTSTADSGAGSLRGALGFAGNGDTIDATGVSGTITLTSGELAVPSSVTILGPGSGLLTVSGNHASRVFNISGTNVTITALTISNGYSTTLNGAGLYIGGGAGRSVAINNCVVVNNATTHSGGGICNVGTSLTLSNCLI